MQCVGGNVLSIWKFDSLDELGLCCMLHINTGICWNLSIWSPCSVGFVLLLCSIQAGGWIFVPRPTCVKTIFRLMRSICFAWCGEGYFIHFTIMKNWLLHLGSLEFNTLPGAPFHMFKNLWVYHDYHTPTKLIVEIARRENISSFWGWHLFLQRFLVIS